MVEMLPLLTCNGIKPVIVCLYNRTQGLQAEVQQNGFDVRFLNGTNFIAKSWDLRRMIRAEQPDLVHTTLFNADQVGRMAAAVSGVPVLSSLVNTSYDPLRLKDSNVNPFKLRVAQMVDGWTSRHLTAHFHAITHAVKESAVRTLGIPPERVTVVERGRTAERLGRPSIERRGRARQQLGLDEDHEVLVNVARQEFQKGQCYLLRAVAPLLQQRPRLMLLIAGRTGKVSPVLTRLAEELGLEERVRFLGHRSDVPEILAAADLFVFPSLYEGLGGALIEAMALGLPIVASDLPVIREVVEAGGNALLVEPASPPKLASAIQTLLDDPKRAKVYGERGRAIFEERFQLDEVTTRMVNLYRCVVEGNGQNVADRFSLC